MACYVQPKSLVKDLKGVPGGEVPRRGVQEAKPPSGGKVGDPGGRSSLGQGGESPWPGRGEPLPSDYS